MDDISGGERIKGNQLLTRGGNTSTVEPAYCTNAKKQLRQKFLMAILVSVGKF